MTSRRQWLLALASVLTPLPAFGFNIMSLFGKTPVSKLGKTYQYLLDPELRRNETGDQTLVIRNAHFGDEKFVDAVWDNIHFINCDFASGYAIFLKSLSRCRFEDCRIVGIISLGVMRDVYFLRCKSGGRSVIGGSRGSVNVVCEECEFIGDSPDSNHFGGFGSNGELTLIRCKASYWTFAAYTLLRMVDCEMQDIDLNTDRSAKGEPNGNHLTVLLENNKFFGKFHFFGAPLHTFTLRNCSFQHMDLTNTSIQGDMLIEKASGGVFELLAGKNSHDNSLTIRDSMFGGQESSRFSASSFRKVLVENCIFNGGTDYSVAFAGGYPENTPKPEAYDSADSVIFRAVQATVFSAAGHNTAEMRFEKCQFDTLRLKNSRLGKLAIYNTQIDRKLDLTNVQTASFITDLPPVSRLGGRVDVLDGSNIPPIGR